MFEQVEAYYRPGNLQDALRLLHNGKGRARIVAGGTDMVVEGASGARVLIDITRAGLRHIRRRGMVLTIGAATTMADLEESVIIRDLAGGILAQAAASCGSPQIRNVATLGGNILNGSAAAEAVTALLVLDVIIVAADLHRRHRITLSEYLANGRAASPPESLLVEVLVPEPPGDGRTGWSFQKFGRTEVDISLVNAAAGLELDARGRVKWARLALGAVAPAPFRVLGLEALMQGRLFDRMLLAEAGGEVMRAVRPVSDVRASADYRREISRVLAERAFQACAAQAGFCL